MGMTRFGFLSAIACAALSGCAYGGTASVVVVVDEAAGANCAHGGVRIDVGPDANQDGAPDRVVSSSYVCNGASPVASLTNIVSEPPGARCQEGGVKIESGLDHNGSGALESAEVIDTSYVCNGEAAMGGATSLTDVTAEPLGSNCETGGVRVDNGLDDDGDGTLDTTEVTSTEYVCNGSDGIDGMAVGGTLSAVTVELSGVNCSAGGVRIQSGRDSNSNGALDGGEVTSTAYVCNGASPMYGSAPIIATYDATGITSSGTTPITVASATITAPRNGSVLVIANVEVFCSSTSAPTCASPGPADGHFTISSTSSALPDSGAYSYFFLAPNTSENLARTAAYTVTAGTYTFYARAASATASGSMGFWRRQMTVVFVPRD